MPENHEMSIKINMQKDYNMHFTHLFPSNIGKKFAIGQKASLKTLYNWQLNYSTKIYLIVFRQIDAFQNYLQFSFSFWHFVMIYYLKFSDIQLRMY